MADKASSNISASIFMDDIKGALGGDLSYEPADSTEKWVFAEISVAATASTDLLDVSDSYLGIADAVATADIV
jgi:hypothetical protein